MAAFLSLFVVLHAALPGQPGPPVKRRMLIVTPQEDLSGTDALYGALSARGEEVAEPADRYGVDQPVPPGAFDRVRIDAVRDRMVEAKAALREFRYPEARTALADAETLLLRAERPELHLALYRDLLLMRAGLDVVEGDARQAEDDLLLVSRIDPTLEELHPGLYPPPLVEAYAKVVAQAQTAGTGVVVVVPRVPPQERAAVWLDGGRVEDGRATLTLPAGPHLLSMGAAGRLTVTRRLDVVGGSSTVLEPFLPPEGAGQARTAARDAMRGEMFPDARQSSAETLLDTTGTTTLVWRGVEEIYVYERGRLVGPLARGKTPLDDASAVLTALAQAPDPVQTALRSTQSGLGPVAPPEDDGTTVQVVVGVSAAAGGLGLVAVASGVAGTVGYLWWLLSRPANPEPPTRPIIISCCGPKGD